MNLSLLFGAFDLLLSGSDYARTNTGWLNFQNIIHPVFIFNEFATLRLFASFVYDFVAIKNLRFRAKAFGRNKVLSS